MENKDLKRQAQEEYFEEDAKRGKYDEIQALPPCKSCQTNPPTPPPPSPSSPPPPPPPPAPTSTRSFVPGEQVWLDTPTKATIISQVNSCSVRNLVQHMVDATDSSKQAELLEGVALDITTVLTELEVLKEMLTDQTAMKMTTKMTLVRLCEALLSCMEKEVSNDAA